MTEISDPQPDSADTIRGGLERIAAKLPKPVRFRIENALVHIDRSLTLLEIDREMASFRAITAEEEAVTALFTALRLRNYPDWRKLNGWLHTHKAAVLLAVDAVQMSMSRGVKNITLEFDFEKRRIDVKIPLSEFGLFGPEVRDLCIKPDEPLNFLHARPGQNGEPDRPDYFDRELAQIVDASKEADLKQLVKSMANQRNLLLYASDNGLPQSGFTVETHSRRRRRVILMVALSIMVLQTRTHQRTVLQAMRAVLDMVPRMPSDAE